MKNVRQFLAPPSKTPNLVIITYSMSHNLIKGHHLAFVCLTGPSQETVRNMYLVHATSKGHSSFLILSTMTCHYRHNINIDFMTIMI